MGESNTIGSHSHGKHYSLTQKEENGICGEVTAIETYHVDFAQYLGSFLEQMFQSLATVHMSSVQLLDYQLVIAESC